GRLADLDLDPFRRLARIDCARRFSAGPVLAPFAGVLADRRDRIWTIRITQWIGCAQASLLAILVVNDAMTIEILFALLLMLGIASGVAQPSRLAKFTEWGREVRVSFRACNRFRSCT